MIDTSCMVSTRVQLPQGDIGKRLEALFYFCAQNVWIPLTPRILLPISTTFKSFFCAFSIISSSLWQQPWRSGLISMHRMFEFRRGGGQHQGSTPTWQLWKVFERTLLFLCAECLNSADTLETPYQIISEVFRITHWDLIYLQITCGGHLKSPQSVHVTYM